MSRCCRAAPGTRSGAAPVVIGAGARGSYYNDHFWGSGGRDNRQRAAGGIATFRPDPNADVTTFVSAVDFDWGTGTPHPAIRPDNHSTVFTGKIAIPNDADGDGTPGETIDVTFVNSSDDDGIIFVNGVEAANDMGPPGHGQQDRPGTPLSLVEGQSYNFAIFQAEQGGGSGVRFKWQNPATGASEVIPGSLLTSVMDVPTAPTLGPGTVAPTSGDERMVTFNLTDNSVSELWFELLRDGVVVGTTQLNAGLDSDPGAAGNQAQIVDAQPTPGTHQYTVRAVNFDGTSAQSAAVSVTVPADYYAAPANGASGYYFNSASWSGGRVGTGLSGGPDIRAAGHPDYGETVSIVDFNYDALGNSPNPSTTPVEGFPIIEEEAFSTVFTGEVLIPEDGDATPGETIAIQFVGNTDDHGVYYVNGQVASTSWIPRGQGDYTGAPPMNLVEGQRYDFVIMQVEQFGGAGVHFKWVNPATNVTEVIPNSNLFPRSGAPAAPTGISQNGNFGSLIILNWTDNSTNEVRYELERSDNATFTTNVRKVILPINSTTYTDLAVERPPIGQPERQYFYRVTAINYEGTGQSATFTGSTVIDESPPTAPTSLTIRASSLTSNTLNFIDTALNDSGFVVERRNVTAGGTFAAINGSPFPGTFSATGPVTVVDNDATLVAGNTYEYQVFAINAEGERSSPALVGQVVAGFPGGTGLRQRIWDSTQEGQNPDTINNDVNGALSIARIGEPGLSPEGNPTAPLVDEVDPSADDGYGANAPHPSIGVDTFAIEWVGEIYAEETKGYEFSIVGDDGVRLWINDRLVIGEAWIDQGDTEYFSEPIPLTAGQKVKVRFQMYEQGGGATARLRWNGANNVREAIPTNFLFPTVAADDAVAVIPFRPVTGAKAFALPGLGTERGPTIAVTWQDNAFGEAGYEVQRATNATFTTGVTTWGRDTAGAALVNAGRTVFIDNGTLPDGSAGTLDNNTTYFYRVRPLGAPDTAWVVAGSTKPVDVDAAAADLNLPNFNAPGLVTTNADATTTAEGSLRLAWNANNQYGSAYVNRSFDVSRDFKVAYDQQIGSGNDADGLAFVMHNHIQATPAGVLPTQLMALGGGGGALAVNGFLNSVAVIFDFHDNIDQMGIWTNGQVPPGGNIAATRVNDGSLLDPNGAIDLRLAENGSVNLDANQRFTIELSYDAEGNDNGTPTDPADDTGVLTVVMKDAGTGAVLNTSKWNIDLETTIGDPTSVIGWTAANGGLNERYEVHNFSYDGAGVATAVVSEVYARGSGWSANFKTYMEGQGLGDDVYGYRVDNKTGDQQVLPWTNINEIVLRYSAPPTGAGIPTPGTVTLTGDRAGGNYTVTAVNQLDPQTFVLVLDRALGNLSTGGENGVRVNLVVPGGGAGGGNFSHVLRSLQGDVAHGAAGSAHSVVAADFSDVKNRFFRTTSAPGPAGPQQYTVFHDVDGSGGILANDFSFVKARFFDSLQTTPFPVSALSGSSITEELFASGKVIG